MQTASIGYTRDDGDFAILATLNNLDDHMEAEGQFEGMCECVRLMWSGLETFKDQDIVILEREDTPSYVTLDEDEPTDNGVGDATQLQNAFPKKSPVEISAFLERCRKTVKKLATLKYEGATYKKTAADFIKAAHKFGFDHQIPEAGLTHTCWIDDVGEIEMSLTSANDRMTIRNH